MYINGGSGVNGQFFRNQLLILKYCALWNPFEALNAPQSDRNSSKMYTIYATVVLTIFYYLLLCTQIVHIVTLNDQKDLSDALFVSSTAFKVAIKIYCFLHLRKEYRALVNEFQHSPVFMPHDEEELRLIEKSLRLSTVFFNAFYILGWGTITFWTVVPIYNYFHDFSLTLPIPAWFPYAHTHLPMFWIACLYQMIGLVLSANLIVALCSFEFTCFCYLNACIQVFAIRLTKIGRLTADSQSQKLNVRSKAYEDIVHLVKHHLLVKRYIRHCEKLTQTSISAEIMFSSVIICMTLFKIVKGIDNAVKFVPALTYLGAMIIQIYQYCFIGNKITYSSNELGISAFFSDFRKFDRRTFQIFLILHKNLQREINVCTGGDLKIKLIIETFIKVMKTSYSFMAVLRAVDT